MPALVRRALARCLSGLTAGLALAAFAGHAGASIRTGDRFELAFTLWDPAAQTSYTLDLGLQDDAFFAQGQSDAGYQRFWNLAPAADPNLARFKAAITNPSQVRWAIDGFDTPGFDSTTPGDDHIFTTLEQGTANGVRNGNYTRLTAISNGTFSSIINQGDVFIDSLNTNSQGDTLNTNAFRSGLTYEENLMANGSTFATIATPGYFGKDGFDHFFERNVSTTNLVGKSSWFYYLGNSGSGNDADTVLVDEFDNLSADGYWGLAIDPGTSNYVLSYTLPAATLSSLASSADGRARAALTEYRSGDWTQRVAAPAGEFDGYVTPSFVTVSAVPEADASWLALVGLAVVFANGAIRRRTASPVGLSLQPA